MIAQDVRNFVDERLTVEQVGVLFERAGRARDVAELRREQRRERERERDGEEEEVGRVPWG